MSSDTKRFNRFVYEFAETLHDRFMQSCLQVILATDDRKDFETGRNAAYVEVMDILSTIADRERKRGELKSGKDALRTVVVGTGSRGNKRSERRPSVRAPLGSNAASPPLVRRAKNMTTAPLHDGDGPGVSDRDPR